MNSTVSELTDRTVVCTNDLTTVFKGHNQHAAAQIAMLQTQVIDLEKRFAYLHAFVNGVAERHPSTLAGVITGARSILRDLQLRNDYTDDRISLHDDVTGDR